MEAVEHLAAYRQCIKRIHEKWPEFQEQRRERLRGRDAPEQVTEDIIKDLFAEVLDWLVGDLRFQVRGPGGGCADIELTRLGIKYLVIETKRPRALAWTRPAVDEALAQAVRYAAAQKVACVAVSDGVMLYAADVSHGDAADVSGDLRDRVFCRLDDPKSQDLLWWLSVDGIYRDRPERGDAALPPSGGHAPGRPTPGGPQARPSGRLHPKYQLPAWCFAHVDDPTNPRTWHLPYLNDDGTVDLRRLPKAIQAIVTNYRSGHFSKEHEEDIPDVLVKLARAAASVGKLPSQTSRPAPAYVTLAHVLKQLDRWEEVLPDGQSAQRGRQAART